MQATCGTHYAVRFTSSGTIPHTGTAFIVKTKTARSPTSLYRPACSTPGTLTTEWELRSGTTTTTVFLTFTSLTLGRTSSTTTMATALLPMLRRRRGSRRADGRYRQDSLTTTTMESWIFL